MPSFHCPIPITHIHIHIHSPPRPLLPPPTVLVHLLTLFFASSSLPSFIPPPLSLYSTFVPLLAFHPFLFFSTAAFPHPFSPSGNVPNYLLLSNFNPSVFLSIDPSTWYIGGPQKMPVIMPDLLVTHSVRLYTQLHQGTVLTSHLILHPLTFLCPTPCLLPFLFSLLPSPQPPFLSTKHHTFQKRSDDPFLLSWHLAKSFTTFSLPHCHIHRHTHTHTLIHTQSYTHAHIIHVTFPRRSSMSPKGECCSVWEM